MLSVALALLIIIMGSCVATMKGVLTPPIAGMLGFSLGLITHEPAGNVALLCIGGYITSYMSSAVLEVVGRTADIQMVLLGKAALPELSGPEAVQALITRVTTLIVFIMLPINPLAGHITGVAALLVTGGLALATATKSASPKLWIYLILQWVVIHFTSIATAKFLSSEPAIGIIIATAIPSIVFGEPFIADEDPGSNNYLDPIRLVLAGILTWVTPGYSATASTSVFSRGTERWLSAGLINCALEGWVIHTFIQGHTSGKSVLGDVLSNFALIGNVPMPELAFPIIGVVLLATICAVAMSNQLDVQPPSRNLLIIPLVIQGIVIYGPTILCFLAVGVVLYKIRRWLQVDQEATLLGIVGIT